MLLYILSKRFSWNDFKEFLLRCIFAEEYYVCGLVPGYPPYPKTIVRGMLHKVLVLSSPMWLYLAWPRNPSLCRMTYFSVTSLSFLGMFLSSSVFHHFQFTPQQFDFWRKVDMSMVALATFGNTVPSLVFYKLFGSLVILILIAGMTGVLVFLWDPRRAMITGICASLAVVSVHVIPNILYQIPGFYTFPIISHMILIVIGLLLFVFGDNDRPVDKMVSTRPCSIWNPGRLVLASHDILHLISVAFFLNFMYFNTLLHQSHLCAPTA